MRIFDEVDESCWWEVAQRCEYATFFHTPLWHRLIEMAFDRHGDISFSAELESGGKAVFPLMNRRHRFLPILGHAMSAFAGCYGGPIADGPITSRERRLLYEAARRVPGRITITGNPFENEGEGPSGFQTVVDTTHLLRLDAQFDELFARFSEGHRRNTGKGQRAGVITRMARTPDEYRHYYEVYQEALKQWGDTATSRYPWVLFEAGQSLAANHEEQIALWLGELE